MRLPALRDMKDMTPEQINVLEWQIVSDTIAKMHKMMEAGCPPGRYSWVDPVRDMARARGEGKV